MQKLLPCYIQWLRELVHELGDDDPMNFTRTSGAVICEICGKEYRRHPRYEEEPDLNRLCDGRYVKL